MPHYWTECQYYRTLQLANIAWRSVCLTLTTTMTSNARTKLQYMPEEVILEV